MKIYIEIVTKVKSNFNIEAVNRIFGIPSCLKVETFFLKIDFTEF